MYCSYNKTSLLPQLVSAEETFPVQTLIASFSLCKYKNLHCCSLIRYVFFKELVYQSSALLKIGIMKENENSLRFTENPFKWKENLTFKLSARRLTTSFSKYIWNLKDDSINNYITNLFLAEYASLYIKDVRKCNSCPVWKDILSQPFAILDKRNKLRNIFRHCHWFLLRNF